MDSDHSTKKCMMCAMEMPVEARKCPYCHHFQNRATMIVYHPAFAMLATSIPLILFLMYVVSIFNEGKDFQNYSSQIKITESKVSFGDMKSNSTVVVIGTITNTSPIPWKEIHFQMDFFDAEGRRVDAAQDREYFFYLPANGAGSFKLSFPREFPETNYVTHNVQVVTAKDASTRW